MHGGACCRENCDHLCTRFLARCCILELFQDFFPDAVNLCTAKVTRYWKLVGRHLTVLFVNFEDPVIA